MRHDVSLTMCFHTLWCRLYQTSEFSASCRPRPRARAVAAVAAGPCRRRGGTGGERAWCLRGFVPSYSGTVYDTLSLTNRNASMISVVVQNFIFDVHDARRAFATGPTAHAAPGTHSRCTLYDLMTVTRPG